MSDVKTLYRPVGQKEFDLIQQSGMREFPPRLSWQPIFYPVLSLAYATEIARDWNTKDLENGSVGFVTEFDVDVAYLNRFPIKRVGSDAHLELWVPAGELEEFNRMIVGNIRLVGEYRATPPARL